MVRDTDQDWATIATDSPYWGILSRPEYEGRTISPELQAQFYASGEAEIGSLFLELRRQWPDFSPSRSFDFGCGVGRLLFPIARRSGHAVGADIAPAMLSMADGASKRFGVDNVELVPSDDDLTAVTGSFDFVHSFIVLQHIPPVRGYRIFRRLLDMLRLGGVFAIHVSFAKGRHLMVHEIPMAKFYRREDRTLYDLVETHNHPVGTVTMFDYDLNHMFAILTEFTDQPVITRLIPEDHLGIYLLGQRNRAP